MQFLDEFYSPAAMRGFSGDYESARRCTQGRQRDDSDNAKRVSFKTYATNSGQPREHDEDLFDNENKNDSGNIDDLYGIGECEDRDAGNRHGGEKEKKDGQSKRCRGRDKEVRDVGDDEAVETAMNAAKAEAAKRGQNSFMQAIAAGEAKDIVLAARRAEAHQVHKANKTHHTKVGCVDTLTTVTSQEMKDVQHIDNIHAHIIAQLPIDRSSLSKRPGGAKACCPGLAGYWEPLPGKRLFQKQMPPSNYKPHVPCVFNLKREGAPAHAQHDRGYIRCMFCDPEQMASTLTKARGSSSVIRSLATFLSMGEHIYSSALDRLPPQSRGRFTEQVKDITIRRKKAAHCKDDATTRWKRALVARSVNIARPCKRSRILYKRRVAADQDRCWKKFFPTGVQAKKRACRVGLSEPNAVRVDARRAKAVKAVRDEREGSS